MNNNTSIIINEMIAYYANDPRRINHFLKVYSFSKSIGELEKLDEETQYILEIAAIMHDSIVSIKNKYFKTKAGTNFLEKLYLS